MRIARAALAILAAGALFVSFAFASHGGVGDGRDTNGTMDVARVDKHGDKWPRWNIRTFASWRVIDIFDSGFALVRLDTFGGQRFDYFALVRSQGRRLRASLWRDRKNKRDYRVRKLKVWRPNKRSLALKVPLKDVRFGPRRLTYRWQVETLFTSSECPNVCFDLVPDSGGIQENNPFVVPTESPTPTPTPSPSLTD